MPYFDTELKTTLFFAVVGIIAGYVSFLFNHTAGATVFAVILFIIVHFIAKKAMKIKEERKWWMTMVVVYFLLWLIAWTIFYNTVVL